MFLSYTVRKSNIFMILSKHFGVHLSPSQIKRIMDAVYHLLAMRFVEFYRHTSLMAYSLFIRGTQTYAISVEYFSYLNNTLIIKIYTDKRTLDRHWGRCKLNRSAFIVPSRQKKFRSCYGFRIRIRILQLFLKKLRIIMDETSRL